MYFTLEMQPKNNKKYIMIISKGRKSLFTNKMATKYLFDLPRNKIFFF